MVTPSSSCRVGYAVCYVVLFVFALFVLLYDDWYYLMYIFVLDTLKAFDRCFKS